MSSINHNHEEDEYDKTTSEDYTSAHQRSMTVSEYKEECKDIKRWLDLDEGKMKAALPLLDYVVCKEDWSASKKRKIWDIIFKKGKVPLFSNVPFSAYSEPNPDPTIFNMVETLFTSKKTTLLSITVVFTAPSGEIEEHRLDSPLAWRDRNVILSNPNGVMYSPHRTDGDLLTPYQTEIAQMLCWQNEKNRPQMAVICFPSYSKMYHYLVSIQQYNKPLLWVSGFI
jgi:hypothetical protein